MIKENNSDPQNISVFILEEQEIFRELYRAVFSTKPDIRLVRISGDFDLEEAKTAIAAAAPDILLLGRKALDVKSIHILQALYASAPKSGILLFVSSFHPQALKLLKRFIASNKVHIAFMLKQSLERIDTIHGAIKSVYDGNVIIEPILSHELFVEDKKNESLQELTVRELEILGLISEGNTNLAIAERLFIDPKTVRHHINNIYSKLKSDLIMDDKHPRVNAARFYLKETGQLRNSAENSPK